MKALLKKISNDSRVNKSRIEVVLFLFVFRIGSALKRTMTKSSQGLLLYPIYFIVKLIYKILSMLYLMEIPLGTNIGEAITIYHLKGIVINENAVIGKRVTINHFITIADNVTIKDGVVINPQSVIVKGVIGTNAIVGAGSVVTKDVAENTIVAGCPAVFIGSVN